MENEELARSARTLAGHAGATTAQLAGAHERLDKQAEAALGLARAISTSPARVTPDVVTTTVRELSPPVIIELVTWIAVLQTLQRLHGFNGPSSGPSLSQT